MHPWFFPLALAYLVLPNLLFLTLWVRPGIGLPAALSVLLSSVWLGRPDPQATPEPGLGRRNWSFILLLAFGWTLAAGAGGFLPQGGDYIKHNLVFHDLFHFAWPVTYPTASGQAYLCYGLAASCRKAAITSNTI